jgi:ubiquinone/menaquinone biosynthesis C-methylase UbiE
MSHTDEYTDAMLAAMDLIWGEGFMAPGGAGNIEQMLRGLLLEGASVLDIGCGQGLPACIVARDYGAQVVGTDLEAHLLDRAHARAASAGLQERVSFVQVAPGPLTFADNSFDAVLVCGAMTQIADKLAMYRECLRVLKPGGSLRCYDWMKSDAPLSEAMYRWFELEGLTYELRTPQEHLEFLDEAGFTQTKCRDKSSWYRREARREYRLLRDELKPRLHSLLGGEEAGRFIESWRLLAELCERGELLQVYSSGCKAAAA